MANTAMNVSKRTVEEMNYSPCFYGFGFDRRPHSICTVWVFCGHQVDYKRLLYFILNSICFIVISFFPQI